MESPKVNLELPPRAHRALFAPNKRYRVLRGGRGSAKSWSAARAVVALTYSKPLFVLCGREIQNTLADSVHRLLVTQIEALGFSPWFDVQKERIRSSCGSEIIFRGIRDQNAHSLKSLEGADIAWIEEGETLTNHSLKVLGPTIRKPGSEIWITFNPDLETDPVYQRFVVNPLPPRSIVATMNWQDNPWFHESREMVEDKDYLYRVDPEAAANVWGGQCRTNSEAQVLRGKCFVESFEPAPGWDGPYQGADWGFSQDPTALVRFWVYDRQLFIEHEAYGVGVDIDATPAMFDKVPGSRLVTTRADNARPETISYMQRHGYPNVVACAKWDGSVEDGVAFLRQFAKIVIHPRCRHTFEESRLWAYKKDRLTGDITTDLVDKHNHTWDAIRYGLEPMIRQASGGLLAFMEQQAALAANATQRRTFHQPTTVEGFPT